MSSQFKSVEPRLAPPSRGQHAGAVVLDVLHRRNSVIIRSKRPSGQAGASLALRALRKHKSAARRVRRAALVPNRATGARAVRLICFSCGRTRPATICQAQFFSATMPRGTSHGAARLLELELDQAGERRTRHASQARSPRTPIALASLTPPASVGVCRERRQLRWSRCASRARATRERAARPRRDRAGVFLRRRARCRRGAA